MERKKTADQTPNNDKKQALDTAIRQIEKNFGKGDRLAGARRRARHRRRAEGADH